MAEPRPAVSVIVPVLDAGMTLAATLDALATQDLDSPYEVIVVDDGSTDATAAIAEAAGPPVRVIRQPRSGPGAARNRGAADARGTVLAFTDADCRPVAGWLREGLAALEHADLVQGRVEPEPHAQPGPFDHTVWVTRPSPLYETANLLVRRELFARVGGFEDWLAVRIGKPLAEDVWFGWRARRAGARVGFEARALVRHAVLARGPRAYVGERLRLFYFPALTRKIPELRHEFLRCGLFLTPATARFDLAVIGTLASLWLRRAPPLAGALPYLVETLRLAAPHRRRAPLVGGALIAADAVGLAALLAGSARWRSPVL